MDVKTCWFLRRAGVFLLAIMLASSFFLSGRWAAGQYLTFIATDVFGNTSEFSRCVEIFNGPP
jgi:hypothetical protein